jgi:1-acyl-sn-glycerol-3-phosphate acyltransferase
VANHSSGADAYIMLGCMTGRFYRRSYAVVHEKEFRKDNLARVFLEAFDMIPRFGTGQQVIKKMAEHLLQNKTITIVPEGMTSDKIMKGYTGVMRLYYMINKLPSIHNTIPILPVVTIGANKAYPIKADPDGKYRTHKVGIIIRLGKPIYYQLPEHPTPEWFRQKTDELMDHIAHMALQKEGVIDSWKQNQLTRQKPREYHQ